MRYSFIGKYLINVVWFRKSRVILIDSARQNPGTIRDTYTRAMREEGTECACIKLLKYVLNWNSYFVGSKDRICQLFQYYSRPDLNWQSNISYSLRSCPPYISIHVFSIKTAKNAWSEVLYGRKGTQLMEILRVYVRDLREIKTSSKLQTKQQCCYIT